MWSTFDFIVLSQLILILYNLKKLIVFELDVHYYIEHVIQGGCSDEV